MALNEQEAKVWRTALWALAAFLMTWLVCGHSYYAIRDAAAIKAGLHQSEPKQAMGGYWVKNRD